MNARNVSTGIPAVDFLVTWAYGRWPDPDGKRFQEAKRSLSG